MYLLDTESNHEKEIHLIGAIAKLSAHPIIQSWIRSKMARCENEYYLF